MMAGIAHRGDPEIGQLDRVPRPDQQVRGFDVAVHSTGGVDGAEGPGGLHGDVDGIGPAHTPVTADAVSERPVFEELHDQVRAAVRGEPGVVDGDDVGMPRQVTHGLALDLEPAPGPLIEVLRLQHLQRDAALEPGLGGSVDDGESALTDLDEVSVALDFHLSPTPRAKYPEP